MRSGHGCTRVRGMSWRSHAQVAFGVARHAAAGGCGAGWEWRRMAVGVAKQIRSIDCVTRYSMHLSVATLVAVTFARLSNINHGYWLSILAPCAGQRQEPDGVQHS